MISPGKYKKQGSSFRSHKDWEAIINKAMIAQKLIAAYYKSFLILKKCSGWK